MSRCSATSPPLRLAPPSLLKSYIAIFVDNADFKIFIVEHAVRFKPSGQIKFIFLALIECPDNNQSTVDFTQRPQKVFFQRARQIGGILNRGPFSALVFVFQKEKQSRPYEANQGDPE